MLKAAVRDPNPVVCLESEVMYSATFDVSEEALSKDFLIPIGKAKIMQEGTDVTLVSFSKGLRPTLEAAKILKD